MSEPTLHARPTPTRLLLAALQIVGFAGASHLLHHMIALFPSYETSDLASSPALFVGAGPRELAEALLLFALVPALLEELLFRGVLFAIFQHLRGPRFAIGASALLFGLAHLDPHHVVVAALLGVQLGLLRHFGGLVLAIAAHLLNNVLALGATFLVEAEGHGLPPFEAGAISLTLALLVTGGAWADLTHRMRSAPALDRESRTDLQTLRRRDE